MNILIIRFSSLGDLVTLAPAFQAYRHFFANDHLTFLTSGVGDGLYGDSDYFDACIINKNFIETVTTLRQTHYDLVINLQCTHLSHCMVLFTHKERVINWSSSMMQKYLHIKSKAKTHLQILEASGYDKNEVEDFFALHQMIQLPYALQVYPWQELSKKTVALAPGTSERWESKKWGDAKFQELAGKLLNAGYNIILIGSALEKSIGIEIESAYPAVINMITRTNLSQLKSLLASVDLLICNDSGPAHLAAGVGSNTLTIFGSTDIKHCVFFGKYQGKHSYIVSEPRLKCQPCYKSKCPTQHECMDAVPVSIVFQKIKEILC